MTLRVTVEIVPLGDESRKRELGRMDISNITYDRTKENEYGEIADYIVRSEGRSAYNVRGHRRSNGFWTLVRKALNSDEAPA